MPHGYLTTHRGDTGALLRANSPESLSAMKEGYTLGVWLEYESILRK